MHIFLFYLSSQPGNKVRSLVFDPTCKSISITSCGDRLAAPTAITSSSLCSCSHFCDVFFWPVVFYFLINHSDVHLETSRGIYGYEQQNIKEIKIRMMINFLKCFCCFIRSHSDLGSAALQVNAILVHLFLGGKKAPAMQLQHFFFFIFSDSSVPVCAGMQFVYSQHV